MIEITEDIRRAAYDCDLAQRVRDKYNERFEVVKHNQRVAEAEYNCCAEKLLSLISDYEKTALKEGDCIYLKVDKLMIAIKKINDILSVSILEVIE